MCAALKELIVDGLNWRRTVARDGDRARSQGSDPDAWITEHSAAASRRASRACLVSIM